MATLYWYSNPLFNNVSFHGNEICNSAMDIFSSLAMFQFSYHRQVS